jgi:hypothetical protein
VIKESEMESEALINGGNGYLSSEGIIILNEERGTSVVMALRKRDSTELFGIKFNDIVGLRFAEHRASFPDLFILMITDVSADGWEGVKYSVRDDEEEIFVFRCRSFEVISIDALQAFVSFLKMVK